MLRPVRYRQKGAAMAIPQAGMQPLADLEAFLEPFGALLRRAESRHALERYTTGLLANIPHKSATAMGQALPGTNGQRLQELLTRTQWDVAAMDRMRIAHMSAHARSGAGALIFDDTGLAKKGDASVGVERQYSGTLGRVDNCQVLVSSHYVDRAFDWPVNARLYLPRRWCDDPQRLTKAQVPPGTGFQTKGEIALDLFDQAHEAGLAVGAVIADAGYGDQGAFLDGLEQREQPYAVAVARNVHVRDAAQVDADAGDPPPPRPQGRGRPRKASRLEQRVAKQSAQALVAAQPERAWRRVAWRQGHKGALTGEFVAIPVYRSGWRGKHLPTRGVLIGERPCPGHRGEMKYYFAWGLDAMPLAELVALIHVRWAIERFYQDAKGELGLDDYEGRRWPGLHRHVALVMLAHSYLALQRAYGPARDAPPGEAAPPQAAPDPGGFPPTDAQKHPRPTAPCPGGLV